MNDILKFFAFGMSVLLSWNGEELRLYLRDSGASHSNQS